MSLTPHNQITLLETGEAFFPALITEIHAARHFIFLETYIFRLDDVGQRVCAALRAAAKRGVVVHVLLDGFGSRNFIEHHTDALTGVQLQIFRRELTRLSLRRQRLHRLHRKLAVIDGQTAFVGGINIESDFVPTHPYAPRFDFSVRVQGPLLEPILKTMKQLWTRIALARFQLRPNLSAFHAHAEPAGNLTARFVIRDSLRHRRDIEQSYLQALSQAQSEAILACAYFFPGKRFRQALIDAARRGVRITLLLEGVAQYPIQYRATQALYGYFLDEGVRIFEYRKTHLHAKVAVVDGHWVTIGSSNIDPLSLLLAREANINVRDTTFAQHLQARLEHAIREDAVEFQAQSWARRSPLTKAFNWCAYGLLRGVMGLLGFAKREAQPR